jgi:two-component system, cell cycle response regulator
MKSRILRVRALGLRPHEQIALKSVCRLSQQVDRSIGFRVADPAEAAEIFIVATDDPGAVTDWQALDPDRLTPFVAVGPAPADAGHGAHLAKPFLASRLLAAMETCAPRVATDPSGDTGAPADAPQPSVAAAKLQPPSPVPRKLPARRGHSVLVVDDSATARKQIEIVLQGMGLQPHCVASGEQALDAIESYYFELILLDVVLPGTDGYQVCKAIKKNPRTKNIPVVMLTSKATQFDRIRGKFAGCDAYLTKSLDRAAFTAVMNEHLAHLSQGPVLRAPDESATGAAAAQRVAS